ncbi:MAG: hypothetical protein ACLT64_09955 [Streptococcus salivarius]
MKIAEIHLPGLSLSGETDLIVATAQKAKRDGKKVLAITGNYKVGWLNKVICFCLLIKRTCQGKSVDYNNMLLRINYSPFNPTYKQYKEYGAIV